MTTWQELTEGLASTVATLPVDGVLHVLEADRPDKGRYLQVTRRPTMLWVGAGAALAAEPLSINGDRLAAYGWSPPDPQHEGLWWLELGLPPVDPSRITDLAARIVGALYYGFGIDSPDRLGYRTRRIGSTEQFTCPQLPLPWVESTSVAALGPGETPTGVLRRAGRLRTPVVTTGRRDEDGYLIVPADRLPEDERAAVVEYLRRSPVIVDVYGRDRDPYQPGRPELVPLHVHTDGEWAWSESLAYYAQRYGFAPDPELLEHLRRRSYRWPELPEETLIELSRALRD